jgi:electron transfer flavoprotein alpha subunit
MPKLLLVALDANDIAPLTGFARAYGDDYDLISLAGKEFPPADAMAGPISDAARAYQIVAFSATMAGKDLAPRVAALMDLPMVSDVIGVASPNTFLRPMYAGNLTATVRVNAEAYVISVRSTAFSGEGLQPKEPLAFAVPPELNAKRISVDEKPASRPDLASASIVVSGGRPLKDAETFERLIGGLADKLGGAVGATRAVVDSGIASNELQVGQTGKIVAPKLYIAAGISGSTQHMAGMKDSKVIVAINTDADAPIFEIADYGLVMDLYEAIPEMIEKLS